MVLKRELAAADHGGEVPRAVAVHRPALGFDLHLAEFGEDGSDGRIELSKFLSQRHVWARREAQYPSGTRNRLFGMSMRASSESSSLLP